MINGHAKNKHYQPYSKNKPLSLSNQNHLSCVYASADWNRQPREYASKIWLSVGQFNEINTLFSEMLACGLFQIKLNESRGDVYLGEILRHVYIGNTDSPTRDFQSRFKL